MIYRCLACLYHFVKAAGTVICFILFFAHMIDYTFTMGHFIYLFSNYFQIESGKGLGTNEMTIESLRASGNKAIFIGIG